MNELKLSVVIPTHNEQNNIGKTLVVLQKILRQHAIPYELIVINDNSRDKTQDIIRSFIEKDNCIKMIDRQPPVGFGRAIRSGLEMVEGDVVVIYMADLSDDPLDVVAYYRKIEEGYDCVYGSRFIKGSLVSHYPIIKLIVNRISNKIVQLLFRCRFNDLTNAFKAYRTYVIVDCGPYQASHFNITIEMSLAPLIRKYSIAEIPIRWYGRKAGVSRMRIIKMSRRYLCTLIKIFFESLLNKDDLIE